MKPKEFWIEKHFDWVIHKRASDNDRTDAIHVIEKSAYDKAVEALKKCKEQRDEAAINPIPKQDRNTKWLKWNEEIEKILEGK